MERSSAPVRFPPPSSWDTLTLQDPEVHDLLSANLQLPEDQGVPLVPSWVLLVGPPAVGKTCACNLYLRELYQVLTERGVRMERHNILVSDLQSGSAEVKHVLERLQSVTERAPPIAFPSQRDATGTMDQHPPGLRIHHWKTLHVFFIDEIAQLDPAQQAVLGEILQQAQGKAVHVVATCNHLPVGSLPDLFVTLRMHPLRRELAAQVLQGVLEAQRVPLPEEGVMEMVLSHAHVHRGDTDLRDDEVDMRQAVRNMQDVYWGWSQEHDPRQDPVPFAFVEHCFSSGMEHLEDQALASLVLSLEVSPHFRDLFRLHNQDLPVALEGLLRRVQFLLSYPSHRLLGRLHELHRGELSRDFSSLTLPRVQLRLITLKTELEKAQADFEGKKASNSLAHFLGILGAFSLSHGFSDKNLLLGSFPASQDPLEEVFVLCREVLHSQGQR